jgi:hypothetical protein
MSDPQPSRLRWYVRRLASMSPGEVPWRVRDKALQLAWQRRQVSCDGVGSAPARLLPGERRFAVVLPSGTADQVPPAARQAVLAAAAELLAGEWEVLGVTRTDMARPDWFHDPVTGRRAPAEQYAFRINQRSEQQTGNVKQVWEISRLQHLTVLASAWYLSRDEAYARRAADQLESWWQANPFLSGVNWTSGIEVGLRLLSMVWIRRLLDDWPKVADLFEHNQLALRQIRWHQQYLAAFRSRGSSANNHVIAEAAGQLAASCAFGWFPESDRWRRRSARLLERELLRNTFGSGVGRELASDYHGFVAELGLLAAVESAAAGHPLTPAVWDRVVAMLDSGAALLDQRLRPPRQGDGDEGRVLLLDGQVENPWPGLLALGSAVTGPLPWWPSVPDGVASTLIAAMPGAMREVSGRPQQRPWRFADAGLTLLRTSGEREPEIWCRCDGGPHGFLSIAAHAHADALSVELRHGGVDILADPGTYCYHGEPEWRSYFRSTLGHNTLQLGGRSQSAEGGPFLWLRHARARELEVEDIGDAVEWTAEHDGYRSLGPPARHRRCVRLDRASRIVDIVDEITGGSHEACLAFHLGPEVHAELAGSSAALSWPTGQARLELPQALEWRLYRGETDPVLGWYSAGLGRRVPAFTLVGRGLSGPDRPFSTRLEFLDAGQPSSLSRAIRPYHGGQPDGMRNCE